MQTVAQLAIYVYWAFYWQPIQDAAALIAAQIVFAYAFDMLLAWSRRDTYTLSFGPFPVIFSINLFLRFRDDFFVLQFVLVAVAFLAKELIRWNKDGRRVHIFNPSSFPLALARRSSCSLHTHPTSLTWGDDIATQLFRPPQIYLFLFLASLWPDSSTSGSRPCRCRPSSATTTRLRTGIFRGHRTSFLSTATFRWRCSWGTAPACVVDPATAPRTELGRIIFGAILPVSSTRRALLGLQPGWEPPRFTTSCCRSRS